jgi:hypothetical protein
MQRHHEVIGIKIIGILLILVIGAYAALRVMIYFEPLGYANVIVRNDSAQLVESVTVVVNEASDVTTWLAPGGTSTAYFSALEANYKVRVVFQDRRELSAVGGYITSGSKSNDVIRITDNAITFDVAYE